MAAKRGGSSPNRTPKGYREKPARNRPPQAPDRDHDYNRPEGDDAVPQEPQPWADGEWDWLDDILNSPLALADALAPFPIDLPPPSDVFDEGRAQDLHGIPLDESTVPWGMRDTIENLPRNYLNASPLEDLLDELEKWRTMQGPWPGTDRLGEQVPSDDVPGRGPFTGPLMNDIGSGLTDFIRTPGFLAGATGTAGLLSLLVSLPAASVNALMGGAMSQIEGP